MGQGFLVVFVGLAIISGYWAVVRRETLWNRDDNPRLVEAEQRVERGPILDRRNVVLARSQSGGNGIQQRTYLTPTIPAVGYYSLKHGVGGIEASADLLLRGREGYSEKAQFFDELLHRQPEGKGIAITLDAALHQEIAAIIEQWGDATVLPDGVDWRGAIVLVELKSGALLALESWPIYDPNTLDEDWDQLNESSAAPLLNRATQGLYQPGGALQLIVLATALDKGVVQLNALVSDPAAPVMIDGQPLGCVRVPDDRTLANTIAAGCAAPLAELGEVLGTDTLQQAFHQWGLGTAHPLEIETETGEIDVIHPDLAAIGQESLTVTPLQVGMSMAAIGNQGVMPPPHLVLKTQSATGQWQAATPQGQAVRIVSSPLAEQLQQLLVWSQDERVSGYTSLALAGADRPAHAWFLGLAPPQAPRYAIAVLLEHAGFEGLDLAEKIGHDSLVAALDQIP
jgi:peptidoglycan glycosyltransferase